MKKGVLILCLVLFSLLITGCRFLPSEPPIEGTSDETASSASAPAPSDVQPPAAPEDAADTLIEQQVEQQKQAYTPVVPEEVNETNETAEEEQLQISGSLKLQSNAALCPHLLKKFDCDRYELARCDVKQTVGQNGFYPDIVSCRDGYTQKGEIPSHKYCFIQECSPLYEENIVYAYGGPVIYAEFIYSDERVGDGIMTHYTVYRCGEEQKEFKTSFDCKTYKSELKNI